MYNRLKGLTSQSVFIRYVFVWRFDQLPSIILSKFKYLARLWFVSFIIKKPFKVMLNMEHIDQDNQKMPKDSQLAQ